MDLEKIQKLSKVATFDELIMAAFIVGDAEEADQLKINFKSYWINLKQLYKDKTFRDNKLSWIVSKKK